MRGGAKTQTVDLLRPKSTGAELAICVTAPHRYFACIQSSAQSVFGRRAAGSGGAKSLGSPFRDFRPHVPHAAVFFAITRTSRDGQGSRACDRSWVIQK